MTNGYVHQIGTFQYRGHTIEAYVVKPTPAPGSGHAPQRPIPIWAVKVDNDRFDAFPASPGDTEEEVRERLERWLDEHLRSTDR